MKKKRGGRPNDRTLSPIPSSSSSISLIRLRRRRRRTKLGFSLLRRRRGFKSDLMAAIALPIGMSFAAVVAQVLQNKDIGVENLSTDHLLAVSTSAVRESLANVLGRKNDTFMKNFEKSFGSTLKTLTLINRSSWCKGKEHDSNQEDSYSNTSLMKIMDTTATSRIVGTNEPALLIEKQLQMVEEQEEHKPRNGKNRDLVPCGSGSFGSSGLGVLDNYVMELARSNDLKTCELYLTTKRLRHGEEKLAVCRDACQIEISKMEMKKSKASFEADVFKTQLEGTRHVELLKRSIDCLVASLLIMSVSLLYAAYVYSYRRITEAAASCSPIVEEPRSWWVPKSVSSFNAGLQILRCQVEIVSRMVFGILMIIVVALLLVHRSATSAHTMAITFIVVLLGVACGIAGKLCVDTLGGNGSLWLLNWELLCLLHFLANEYTPLMYCLLYGAISVIQKPQHRRPLLPYWLRRTLFYSMVTVFLPLSCGLLPFASPYEWKDHFATLAADYLPPLPWIHPSLDISGDL